MRNFHHDNQSTNRGDFRPGGRGPERSGFPQRSWGDRPEHRETVMHQAICADCGNNCEVPFRPTQGKPVYCTTCFANKGMATGDRFPKRNDNFEAKPKPNFTSNGGNEDMKKQLQTMNVKIDRIIQLIETYTHAKPVPEKKLIVEEVEKTTKLTDEKPTVIEPTKDSIKLKTTTKKTKKAKK